MLGWTCFRGDLPFSRFCNKPDLANQLFIDHLQWARQLGIKGSRGEKKNNLCPCRVYVLVTGGWEEIDNSQNKEMTENVKGKKRKSRERDWGRWLC